MFSGDPAGGDATLHWFDTLGFVPAQPAPGRWDGDVAEFVRTSPRGMTRHRYRIGAGRYTLELDSSFDGGTTWEPVMRGTYRRVHALPYGN